MEVLISYLSSAIATVLGVISPFFKKMRYILVTQFLTNFTVALSYVILGKWSGGLLCGVACIMVLINYFYDSRQKKIPIPLVIVYILTFVAVNLISFHFWYDVFPLAGALLFVLAIVQTNPSKCRAIVVLNCLCWVIYDILAHAYGNLITHSILLVTTALAVYVRDIRKQKSQPEDTAN